MALGIVTKTTGGGDDSWMGSRHGVAQAATGTLKASTFTSKLVKDKNGEYRCSEGLSSEERGKYLDSEVTATIRQLIDSDDLFQKYIEGAIARSRGISIKCTQQ